jgi:hypothetical protein
MRFLKRQRRDSYQPWATPKVPDRKSTRTEGPSQSGSRGATVEPGFQRVLRKLLQVAGGERLRTKNSRFGFCRARARFFGDGGAGVSLRLCAFA